MRVGSSWRRHLSRAMRPALRWCRPCRPKTGGRGRGGQPQPSGGLRELWSYSKLLLKSLYFNSLTNSDTLLDCAFEPVYWIVDNVTRWFGVVFVTLVILLTTSVVVIVYLYVLPTILGTYAAPWIIWHLCCGHWLLVMLVFHYYKATTTSPGHPPKDNIHIPSVSICKKCINPKPARTHHCSICNTCVLKMDHHCRILVTTTEHASSLAQQLRGPFQPPLFLLLLPLHDSGLHLLQRQQQRHVPRGLQCCRELLSDPSPAIHVHTDNSPQEHHLSLGADQLRGGRPGRADPVARRAHQPRGDQRGAPHQPQREKKTQGAGQGKWTTGSGCLVWRHAITG
ncbi:palmitoyltransferase ZDHHC16B isoform X4 [Phycodurus eques]|uniref:palmitoyltransferase ZDHHC16B isoform X4 n=1 Tax=Phycodurus eques TaxID=693459 RepID=UPI002ACDBB9F|nr:palmitoyltransferase ZDHHC16B isoform X4 [Phycodurus eques]